jgi:hypothetical protein
MTVHHRGRGLLVTVGLLGALAAGCSGSGTLAPTATPTAAPTTPAPATTAAPTSAPAAGPTSEPPAPGPADGNPQRCDTPALRGSLGPGDGAAGSINQPLVLTNVGSRTCELRGFPGVSYVAGADGHQVGPAAAMSGPRGGQVTLAPGKSATALLKLVNVGNYDAAVCKPVPVLGLRVYPPGATRSLYVERAGTGCSATPPGDQISVQTLT